MSGPAVPVNVNVTGIPAGTTRVLLHHYRIDSTHRNAYTAWKGMGSPEHPNPEEYAKLEEAGQLQLLDSPRWIESRNGAAQINFTLPPQGISLIQVSW